MKTKKVIPIFFATDDNYVPCLSVAIHSMIKNQSKNFKYAIKILNSGLSDDSKNILNKYNDENNEIEYVDVTPYMTYLSDELHTRDYYSKTTYYRLFIPRMFPQYSKALYLDCDIVINGDISKFYNINIGNRLVGAIPDEVVQATPEFIAYVEKALGIPRKQYFNAGILIMNLQEFRKQNFEQKFVKLLNTYTFKVAQDQDYLNVICNKQVHYINVTWDKMPLPNKMFGRKKPMLVHYNMGWKPWKSNDILYQDYFWEYAKETSVYEKLIDIKNKYTLEAKEKDRLCGEGLINMCVLEANSPVNYYNLYGNKPEEDNSSDSEEAFQSDELAMKA